MLLLPPRSTLFPTRRSSDLELLIELVDRIGSVGAIPRHRAFDPRAVAVPDLHLRSEEYTSELQSHSDLVCRLLLEKKKRSTAQSSNKTMPVLGLQRGSSWTS